MSGQEIAVNIKRCRTRGSLFSFSAQIPHAPVIAPIQGNRATENRPATKMAGKHKRRWYFMEPCFVGLPQCAQYIGALRLRSGP